jgi:hypothetical protein
MNAAERKALAIENERAYAEINQHRPEVMRIVRLAA